jgi:hypothetical protein
MSDVMNPNYPDEPTGPTRPASQAEQPAPAPRTAPAPTAQAAPATTAVTRPALVTFAAVIMFLLAAFQLIFAIVEFYNAAWFAQTIYGTFSDRLWLWGIIDLVVAAVAAYAGYDLLRGGTFGRIVGFIAAASIGVRWFFYLPADPWEGIVMIALAVLVIYGLVANLEYFDSIHAR